MMFCKGVKATTAYRLVQVLTVYSAVKGVTRSTAAMTLISSRAVLATTPCSVVVVMIATNSHEVMATI